MIDHDLVPRIKETLALTDDDVARLSGVDVDLVARWSGGRGVGPDDEKRIEPLSFVAQFMREWYLEPLIPELVRQPLPGLGDRSVLDALADEHEPVVGYLSGLFSFPEI